MYLLAAIFPVASVVSSADTSILFSTDFSALPDGGVNDEWEFNHPGAHAGNGVQWDDWSAEFRSVNYPLNPRLPMAWFHRYSSG